MKVSELLKILKKLAVTKSQMELIMISSIVLSPETVLLYLDTRAKNSQLAQQIPF